MVRAETSAGFNDNPVPGNSPIVQANGSSSNPILLHYRIYIDAKVRFDTLVGGSNI